MATTQTDTSRIVHAPPHSPDAFVSVRNHLSPIQEEVQSCAQQKGPMAGHWGRILTALNAAIDQTNRGLQEASSNPGGGEANGGMSQQTKT